MTPNPDLTTLVCRRLPGGVETQLTIRYGSICLLCLADPEDRPSTLIYLHPVAEQPLSWRGRESGYALTVSYQALKQLPLLGQVVPYFLNYRTATPLEVASGESVRSLEQFFATLALQQNVTGDERRAIMATTAAALLLCTRQLIRQHLPFDGNQQPNRMVARFAELLEAHYLTEFGLAFYAQQLHVTEDHLSRTCQRMQGRSAKDLILDRRFEEIVRLLLTSDLRVNEIADRLHFRESGYFSRTFMHRYGVSAKEFRRLGGQVSGKVY